jgi:hypothetical protein
VVADIQQSLEYGQIRPSRANRRHDMFR